MTKVTVYIDNSVCYEYEVASPEKGREHAAAIIATGYRHTPKDGANLTWFPPHRINKVTVEGAGESSNYRDTARAT